MLLATQIGKFWYLVAAAPGGQEGQSYCSEAAFLDLNRRLYKALIPDWKDEDEQELVASSSKDWKRDISRRPSTNDEVGQNLSPAPLSFCTLMPCLSLLSSPNFPFPLPCRMSLGRWTLRRTI